MIVIQYNVSPGLSSPVVHAYGGASKADALPYLSHLHSEQSLGDAAWLVLQAGLAAMRPASLKVPSPTDFKEWAGIGPGATLCARARVRACVHDFVCCFGWIRWTMAVCFCGALQMGRGRNV